MEKSGIKEKKKPSWRNFLYSRFNMELVSPKPKKFIIFLQKKFSPHFKTELYSLKLKAFFIFFLKKVLLTFLDNCWLSCKIDKSLMLEDGCWLIVKRKNYTPGWVLIKRKIKIFVIMQYDCWFYLDSKPF